MDRIGIEGAWVSVWGVGMGNKLGEKCPKIGVENCVFGPAR